MDKRRAGAPPCGWRDLGLDRSGGEKGSEYDALWKQITDLSQSVTERSIYEVLLYGIWRLPQSTEEEVGSGTRGYRRREVRPAPRGLLGRLDCSASALQSQSLHS